MIVSILSMYNYDTTLFNNFTLPENIPADLKQTCIEDICSQLAEFSVAYPDLDTMRYMIGVWSKKNQYAWKTLYNTTIQEYNPIENYDRNEDFISENTSDSSILSSGESKNYAAGYNTETAQLTERSESDGLSSGENRASETRTGRIHGNIGVTTSQQMLAEERKIAEYSFINSVTQSFKNDFCIMVY